MNECCYVDSWHNKCFFKTQGIFCERCLLQDNYVITSCIKNDDMTEDCVMKLKNNPRIKIDVLYKPTVTIYQPFLLARIRYFEKPKWITMFNVMKHYLGDAGTDIFNVVAGYYLYI